MHFARLLRAAGLRIGSDRVIDCVRALEITGANQEVMRRDDWYWTMSAVLLLRQEHCRHGPEPIAAPHYLDRKSTRLNSRHPSHLYGGILPKTRNAAEFPR